MAANDQTLKIGAKIQFDLSSTKQDPRRMISNKMKRSPVSKKPLPTSSGKIKNRKF
jgi:hypothetical protein